MRVDEMASKESTPVPPAIAALLDAVGDLQHGSMCARNIYEDGECDCNLEPLDGLAAAVRLLAGRALAPTREPGEG
jgi:hypothetical protein